MKDRVVYGESNVNGQVRLIAFGSSPKRGITLIPKPRCLAEVSFEEKSGV